MKSIEITFHPDGTITTEGKNFQGKECDAKMKAYEEALGTVTDRKDKAEYHQATPVTHSLHQKA